MRMWCRYCGTCQTSRWRPSPWGPKKLCNAHWKQWEMQKLHFPKEEPDVPLAPLENNEYVCEQRRLRPKRDGLQELMEKSQYLLHLHRHIPRLRALWTTWPTTETSIWPLLHEEASLLHGMEVASSQDPSNPVLRGQYEDAVLALLGRVEEVQAQVTHDLNTWTHVTNSVSSLPASS